jgi:epoxyqueuosine reductase QueG
MGRARAVIDSAPGPAVDRAGASQLSQLAKAHAFALGFDLVGIAPLGPADTAAAFDEWLADGRAGVMHYLERGAEKRRRA